MTLTGSSSTTTNSTTTDSNGNWTLTRATPSPDHYSIQVTSNESGTLLESEETTIKSTYDIEAHELSISFPENESSFSTSTLTLLGKSPAGTLNILVDSVVTASIFVSGGSWSQEISFSENKDYEISVTIHHNGISKTTDSIIITKNNIPLITETSNKNITNKSFTISGTAKENTLLTITAYKPNYIPHSGQSTESVTDFESIIGTITSDSNGNWSLVIPIEYSGNYSFIVYEEYGATNQINSETYSYDLNLENIETKLMIAPSPYNPQNGTLKIQYQIPDNQDVGINIYTLSGYRIYESTFLAGSPGALKGQNTITWDGRYNGSYISPGLYIIILKTGSDTAPIIKSKRVGVKW